MDAAFWTSLSVKSISTPGGGGGGFLNGILYKQATKVTLRNSIRLKSAIPAFFCK